jgi:hypothetical protein
MKGYIYLIYTHVQYPKSKVLYISLIIYATCALATCWELSNLVFACFLKINFQNSVKLTECWYVWTVTTGRLNSYYVYVNKCKHKISAVNFQSSNALQETIKFWLMTNLTHSFSLYLFHASTCFEQVLIIRRTKFYKYIIWYDTIWWVTVRRAGTSQSPTRVCYTRWCIDKSWSSWWLALVARNM